MNNFAKNHEKINYSKLLLLSNPRVVKKVAF